MLREWFILKPARGKHKNKISLSREKPDLPRWSDFMFQLNEEEYQALRSQFATLKPGRGTTQAEENMKWRFFDDGSRPQAES